MKKLVLIGANGQLGTDLVKVASRPPPIVPIVVESGHAGEPSSSQLPLFDLVPLTHRDVDVCDHAATRTILSSLTPDVVINTAAYHRVDDCEDNSHKSFDVNAIAVRNLALVCRDLDATLLHMSTDYVFGNDRARTTPYTEDDQPWPLNVYGASKLAGEFFVRNLCPKHFVVRTSGLYGVAGSSGKGGNFVELMLRLGRQGSAITVVDDQRLATTYTLDLATKILELVLTEGYGLYHITNAGSCTWYEFAVKALELAGIPAKVSPTTTAQFGAKADRPKYSVLTHRRLEQSGLTPMRPFDTALAAYLQERSQIGS